MSDRWYVERKKEQYYKLAKKRGYRARSAYKLLQINNKFHIIKKRKNVVDLGAAPGGWCQVTVELVEEEGAVVGVDLDHIIPLEGAVFIRGDIREKSTVNKILEIMPEIDVVISDISPNLSGNYSMDQARSYELSKTALDFSTHYLKTGGHFVTKIFQGELLPKFLKEAKTVFRLVKSFRPPASRKKSSEIYVICKRKRTG